MNQAEKVLYRTAREALVSGNDVLAEFCVDILFYVNGYIGNARVLPWREPLPLGRAVEMLLQGITRIE